MSWRSIFIGVAFALGAVSAPAYASENGQEKLTNLYAQYKGAMKNKNYSQAFDKALKAWEYSEEIYGDSKTTGDFAYNYAVIGAALKDKRSRKRIIKAFERSQALAKFHGNDDVLNVQLQRRSEYADYLIIAKMPKKAEAQLKQASREAEHAGLQKAKIYGDIFLASTRLAYNRKKYDEAFDHAHDAYAIYLAADQAETKDAYEALFYHSRLLEKREDYGLAYLGYEKIYLNLGRVLKKGNQLVGRSYLRAYQMRSKYRKENDGMSLTDTIEAVCAACWPNFDLKHRPLLINSSAYDYDTVPPIMPSTARSSASTTAKYDTDENGKPINIELIYRSHSKTFDLPVLESVAKWTVYEKGTKTPAANKKDLVTKSTFILSTRGGDAIDFYGRVMD